MLLKTLWGGGGFSLFQTRQVNKATMDQLPGLINNILPVLSVSLGPRWKETAVRADVVWLAWLLQNNCFHTGQRMGAWQGLLVVLLLVSTAAVAAAVPA